MSDDAQILDDRLCNEHAIEWIRVMPRKRSYRCGMRKVDWKERELAIYNSSFEWLVEFEFSKGNLDRDFPRRCRADINSICARNGITC